MTTEKAIINRLVTGVPGLDQVLGGGLPECDAERGLLLCGYSADGSRWRVRIDAQMTQWLIEQLQQRLI